MALLSKQSDWGQSERTFTTRSLVASLFIMLVAGCILGYLVRGAAAGGDSPSQKLQAKSFSQSDVIDTNISAVDVADKSPQGAVRAVTSFITGLPSVSLETPQQEEGVLNDLIAPTADPSVRSDLENAIDTSRDQLVGTGSFQKPLTTKLLYAPASYRVDMLAPDRARVQVWYVGVIVDSSSQQADSQWYTNDIQVQWTDHWRIATFSGVAGPTPTVIADSPTGQPDSYAQVVAEINGFTAFRPALAASS